MPTIIIHPEHVEALRYMLVDWDLDTACEEKDVDALRELIPLADQLGWKEGDPVPSELELPEARLERWLRLSWELGNSFMSEIYSNRGNGRELPDPEAHERQAKSLLGFHEYAQGQKGAS